MQPLFSHADLPEGTVTFLFSDIQGSTPHWESQPDLMETALKQHNEILFDAIQANAGMIFKLVGDEIQAVFRAVPQALHAAIEGQRNLQAADWNELGPLQVRMGIHTGEAYRDQIGDEYEVSHAKNRAGRIMSAGHGGQILMSQESANLSQVRLKPDIGLIDLGEIYLKGLSQPERIFQVTAPGLAADFPPLASARQAARNLPANLTRFIGRQRETDQVRQLLREHSLVTIIGPGGVGKTRLSLNVASREIDNFKDGVFFVALDPITSPKELAPAIANALQFPLSGVQEPLEQLLNYLNSREILLVLDNFEHILDSSKALAALLADSPGLKLLATSREALKLVEEWRYPLKGLSYPDLDAIKTEAPEPVGDWMDQDAVRLFIERVRQARGDFSPEAEMESILRICQLVEGSPLALELAAAWSSSFDCPEIAAEIEANLSVLSSTMRNLPERHRSLKAIFNQTWAQLSEHEQGVFMRLSVFRGGFKREAAQQVAGASMLDLSRLVDKSLLRREGNRYQIDPLHPGMIAPGLSETVGAIVAPQTNFLADSGYKFPGLSSFDVLLGPGVEEQIALRFFQNEKICFKVFNQSFLNALVDCNLMALSSLLFLDPEAVSDFPIFIDELIALEFQKVGYSQSGIDPHNKQQ